MPPGLKQSTDVKGETTFTDLKSGQYVIVPDFGSIPAGHYIEDKESKLSNLMEGENSEVDFLFMRESGLKVRVKVEKKIPKEQN